MIETEWIWQQKMKTKLMICVLVRRKHGAEIFIFSVKSLIFGYLKSQTFQLHCDSPHTDTL